MATSYPTWTAGQRVTAAALTSMQFVTAVKTANQSVTSSTTLVNDTHLLLPVVANATYFFDGFFDYDGNFGAPGDIKFDWSIPAGATLRWGPLGNASADTTQKYSSTTGAATTALSAGTYGIGATRNGASPRGYVTVGGTAGNLQLRWAQNSSSATTTTMYAGSWIRLMRNT